MDALDKEKLKKLLREADTKYYASAPDNRKFDYEGHLDFTADYLVKHLKGGKDKAKSTSHRGYKSQRQNSPVSSKPKKKLQVPRVQHTH